MNNKAIDYIQEIRLASEKKRLVLFIGAGVSRNSGYMSWNELVALFDKEIQYSKETPSFYSNDQLLRIPQYFFQMDPDKYRNMITEKFNWLPTKTNPIIDELLHLNPEHIITTNYDRLIEQSLENSFLFSNTIYQNWGKYEVIKQDSDFVNAQKNNYLIKMHGDIDTFDAIVLKEEDYLNYSNTHILIETYIKSLFANHTFLFVGYGLGDYNLKLIMSWVENMTKDPLTRKHFFINANDKPINVHEMQYLKKKNIFIIESSKLPRKYPIHKWENKSKQLKSRYGKNVYRVCCYLNNEILDTIDNIAARLKCYDDLPCITQEELWHSLFKYDPHMYSVYDRKLYISSYMYNVPVMENIIDALKNKIENPSVIIIRQALLKANIFDIAIEINDDHSIHFEEDMNDDDLPEGNIRDLIHAFDNIKYEFLSVGIKQESDMYTAILNNDYQHLFGIAKKRCQNKNDKMRKGYIYALMGYYDKTKRIIKPLKEKYKESNDVFNYILCNYNFAKIDHYERPAFYKLVDNLSESDYYKGFTLYEHIKSFPDLTVELSNVYRKTQNKFHHEYYSVTSDKKNIEYLKIKEKIIQINRYFIENNIYIHGISGINYEIGCWTTLVKQYLDMTLYILSPMSISNRGDVLYEKNLLCREDLYLFINDIDANDLQFLLNKYNVIDLQLTFEQIEYLINNWFNISLSLDIPSRSNKSHLASKAKNIMLLLNRAKLHTANFDRLFQSIELMWFHILDLNTGYDAMMLEGIIVHIIRFMFNLIQKYSNIIPAIHIKTIIQKTIDGFIKNTNDNQEDDLNIYMQAFLRLSLLENFSILLDYYYHETIAQELSLRFLDHVKMEYSNYFYQFTLATFPILQIDNKIELMENLQSNTNFLTHHDLYEGLTNGALNYNKNIENRLVQLCVQQCHNKSDPDSNDKSKPLHIVMRLHERRIVTNIEPFKPFIGYYPLFDFVCFPKQFDYRQFDIYWSNLLFDERHWKKVLDYGYDIVKEKYENAAEGGYPDIIKAVYYKYFYHPYDTSKAGS